MEKTHGKCIRFYNLHLLFCVICMKYAKYLDLLQERKLNMATRKTLCFFSLPKKIIYSRLLHQSLATSDCVNQCRHKIKNRLPWLCSGKVIDCKIFRLPILCDGLVSFVLIVINDRFRLIFREIKETWRWMNIFVLSWIEVFLLGWTPVRERKWWLSIVFWLMWKNMNKLRQSSLFVCTLAHAQSEWPKDERWQESADCSNDN